MAFPNTKFQRFLAAHHACKPARHWVGARSMRRAVADTNNLDWLTWLLWRLLPSRRRTVFYTRIRGIGYVCEVDFDALTCEEVRQRIYASSLTCLRDIRPYKE